MTKTISSSEASVADVIPNVAALKRLLRKEVETDHGVKAMKSTLLDSVNKRFKNIYSDPLYCIATVLDPRYKCFYFNLEEKQSARDMIQAVLDKENPQETAVHSTGDATQTQRMGEGTQRGAHSDSETSTRNPEQSAAKRPHLSSAEEEETKPPSLSDMFSKILRENITETR